ncbi:MULTISPECIES: DUF6349 family protein [Cryobacterium]|uniref:Uncharacterized protein n=1 Tax=Cryobacterium breve TaxID=1259258 RepID=A0ABY2J4E3_9MICO|nr:MULTISPECIES: DUF6349 family protein [Cryobacterium]TFC92059.1 hypothetical protein E3T20_12150 [Cryobacterium sp. TmT3-12]TFC99802.1 hypothetical protein E3O65_05355 [Cryobacterium breve]
MSGQLGWDFDDLIEKPAYAGAAPLHFTVEAFGIDQLNEAFERYRADFGNFNCLALSHMWRSGTWQGLGATPNHGMSVFAAALGCEAHYRISCSCVSSRVVRAVCECGWVSTIREDESPAVEEWHDHAWPGWRDLPVVQSPNTASDRNNQFPRLLTAVDYPKAWMVPGAPVITEREYPGSRHVPGYSPWGGYDISFTALGADR